MSLEVDSNDLISTPRPSPSEERAAAAVVASKQAGVLQKLIHLTFDRRALLLVIFFLIVGLVVQPMLFVNRLVEPEKIFAIDAEGNIIMGPAARFEKSTRLHTLMADEATIGLFNRTPAGFAHEDFLTTLFAEAPLAKARAEFRKEEEDYKKRDIYQSAFIHHVRVSVSGDDYYLRVDGELHRSLVDNLQPFRETPPFQVVFHCKRNPRVTSNNRFPLVVVDYHYEGAKP